MKRSSSYPFYLTLLILLIYSSIAIAGGGTKDAPKPKRTGKALSPDCLQVCAEAILEGEGQKGVTVKLYCGNEEVMSIDSTEFSKVYFTLKRDMNYTVEISKEGYVPRLVSISTFVPKNIPLRPLFRFEFEVEMLKEVKGHDNIFVDFPVALVSFNRSKDCFEYSKKYTTRIKQEIARIKKGPAMSAKE